MQLLSHAVLTVSLVASLLWGLIYSHCVRMALFFKIVLFGEGCILLGELFTVAMYVCLGETEVFHLGMLGPVGCFVFLFSASFGQIDGLYCEGRMNDHIPYAFDRECYTVYRAVRT